MHSSFSLQVQRPNGISRRRREDDITTDLKKEDGVGGLIWLGKGPVRTYCETTGSIKA